MLPHRLFAAICVLSALFASCSTQPRDITAELKDAVSEGKFYYGHQDDLMYGHAWNACTERDSSMVRSDVREACGFYPAILGLDLGGMELGWEHNLDKNWFDLERIAIQKHWERGGIVTLSWHLHNPLTGGSAWDVSSDRAVKSILPGGENEEKFTRWLDSISDFILTLKDKDGKQIPVIWRPWHEHSGSWFWWGKDLCTADEFNALWKLTYDHMVKKRGIEGLVWAISPNMVPDFENWEERYPGDGYVDIVGLDYYSSNLSKQTYVANAQACFASLQKFCEKHGKILAFTETGEEGIRYDRWWSEWLMKAIDGYPVAYVLTWRNACDRPEHFFAPFKEGPGTEDFIQNFCGSDKVLMLNE